MQADRQALEAKVPPADASTEARDAYRKQVKNLNARIEDYEAQYADFKEKEKAFNDSIENRFQLNGRSRIPGDF